MNDIIDINHKHVYQFELWEECNSKCKFCYLGNNNKKTPDEVKNRNISNAIQTLKDGKIFKEINCIGYIGGEFFQGQLNSEQIKNNFIDLMKYSNFLISKKIIKECWISASLLIGKQEDLFLTLQQFDQNNIQNIWILTSYDTIGRFYSQTEKDNWINNIKKIKNIYPTIRINITSITTGHLIAKYLDNSLDLYEIAEEFDCSVFLKPVSRIEGIEDKYETNKIIPNFFPERKAMLDFLIKYKQNESPYLYDKLFNMSLRADYLQLYGHRQEFAFRDKSSYEEIMTYTYDNQQQTINRKIKCGHSDQYQCYVDSNKCLICDKEMIRRCY